MRMSSPNPDEHLPLRPVVFGILSVLRAAPLHGYGIMQQANEHVGERALLGPGTLYRTLKELRSDDLIGPVDGPGDADARRQYYALTDLGESVVEAETRRLGRLMESSEFAQQRIG